jgi:hypothetical protein
MNGAFEKHNRVRKLARLWGFCDNTIVSHFASEPEVLRLERVTAKRRYVTMSIPETWIMHTISVPSVGHSRLAPPVID